MANEHVAAITKIIDNQLRGIDDHLEVAKKALDSFREKAAEELNDCKETLSGFLPDVDSKEVYDLCCDIEKAMFTAAQAINALSAVWETFASTKYDVDNAVDEDCKSLSEYNSKCM